MQEFRQKSPKSAAPGGTLVPSRRFERGGGCVGSGGMRASNRKSRAGEYRDKAATIRLLAYDTKSVEAERRLLAVAKGFERLADQVEAWEDRLIAVD